jgi:hypothetical protein
MRITYRRRRYVAIVSGPSEGASPASRPNFDRRHHPRRRARPDRYGAGQWHRDEDFAAVARAGRRLKTGSTSRIGASIRREGRQDARARQQDWRRKGWRRTAMRASKAELVIDRLNPRLATVGDMLW